MGALRVTVKERHMFITRRAGALFHVATTARRDARG